MFFASLWGGRCSRPDNLPSSKPALLPEHRTCREKRQSLEVDPPFTPSWGRCCALPYFFQSIRLACHKNPNLKVNPLYASCNIEHFHSKLLLHRFYFSGFFAFRRPAILFLFPFWVFIFHVSTHMRVQYESTHTHESAHAPNI